MDLAMPGGAPLHVVYNFVDLWRCSQETIILGPSDYHSPGRFIGFHVYDTGESILFLGFISQWAQGVTNQGSGGKFGLEHHQDVNYN